MTLFLRYSDPGGIETPAALVALGSNIRFGNLGLAMSAELGTPAVSTVEVDDPGGIWNFVGLRAFDVRETAAASNNTVIGRFVIQNRTVTRSKDRSMMTGADRLWSFSLTDYNWHVGKRILIDADSKRPAETAGDRLRWLLHSAANITLYDYGHVTYPSTMLDAHDYRGETAGTVLSDCCVEDQYDFWVDHNEAHGQPELFFLDPDSTAYVAAIAISNDLDDVDSVTTFAPYMDASLERSAERIAAGVYLPYNGGYIYAHSQATAGAFANVDRAAPMATVHTAAKATRLANKFLAINNEESDRITVGIKVPASQVNDLRHGHRVFVRFTHLPGYETGRWTRCLQRQVIQDEEGGGSYYRLIVELVPSGTYPPPPPGPSDYTDNVFAGVQDSTNDGTAGAGRGFLDFSATYAVSASGWSTQADTGPISTNAAKANGHYNGVTVTQPMTVRIYARAFCTNNGGFSPVLAVKVNGVTVGSATTSAQFNTFLKVDLRSYHLEAGDVVTVQSSPQNLFWTNSGVNGTQLIVGRGSYPFVALTGEGLTAFFEGP